MSLALLTALAVTIPAAAGDTTLALRRGDRVVIELTSGDVVVRAWERPELRVTGEDERAAVSVARSGSSVRVTAEDRRGRRRREDVTVWMPVWAGLEVRGRWLGVSVVGLAADVRVSTFEGDVDVSDVRGAVAVRTVEGDIVIRRVQGDVVARSEGDDVRLESVEGSVEVESGSGDLVLAGVDGPSVRAETLDGDIFFDGEVRSGGTYGFYVHDGDVVLRLARDAGARVRVSTFDGEFTSDFPVRVDRFAGGRRFEFVLGDGSAQMEVEVVDGEIQLTERR